MTARAKTRRSVSCKTSTTSDKNANVEKAVQGIHEAARRGATIVCLQELFASPYFCQVEDAALFDLAEAIPGPTTEMVAKAAAKPR